jgi:hypothetical protein
MVSQVTAAQVRLTSILEGSQLSYKSQRAARTLQCSARTSSCVHRFLLAGPGGATGGIGAPLCAACSGTARCNSRRANDESVELPTGSAAAGRRVDGVLFQAAPEPAEGGVSALLIETRRCHVPDCAAATGASSSASLCRPMRESF